MAPLPPDTIPTASRPVVFGRYELLGRLGGGGMATVYAARLSGPAGFERKVAIKLCHDDLAKDEAFVKMFLDEARIAAAIRHRNVVSVLEVETDPRLYMVMDLVEGVSLQWVLSSLKSPTLPMPVALRVLCDALRGLDAAHELTDSSGAPLRVVHRDVSPANVLIGHDGVSRISDFGVARAEQRLATTVDGALKGRFAYMAPEQLRYEEVDRRLDVWSAGVVLWEALTGRRLFRKPSPRETVARVLSGRIPPPSEARAEIPKALDDVIMRALSRDADRRFASAADFRVALEGAGIPLAADDEVASYIADFDLPRLDPVDPLMLLGDEELREDSAPSAPVPELEGPTDVEPAPEPLAPWIAIGVIVTLMFAAAIGGAILVVLLT